MASGNTSLDILISSTFQATGFNRAATAINNFVKTISKANAAINNSSTTAKNANNSVSALGNSTKNTANTLNSATSGATKAAEAYRKTSESANNLKYGMNTLSRSFTETGQQITSANSALSGFKVGTTTMESSITSASNNSKSAFSGFVSSVKGGLSNVQGYFGGLIKQTISVGDIFGYYIGGLALDAVYQFIFGVSTMRDEMETTFEYMGMAKSTVEEFSAALTDFAVKMPTLSIAGANKIARTLAMTGVKTDDILKFKQVWADIAEIGASLNDLNPEVAASKVGPAITDAMGGQYKRLLNLTNITTTQFKNKAEEMGLATTGSFTNTMKVIQSILGDRGLSGVSAKITSITDAWDYMSELISQKGSEIGDYILPLIKSGIWAISGILDKIPTPILGIVAAVGGLLGGLMVVMPFLGSFVNGFNLLKLAVQPITSRLGTLTNQMRGFEKVTGLTNKQLKTLDSLTSKQLKEVGLKRQTQIVPGSDKPKTIYYEAKLESKDAEKGFKQLQKDATNVNGAVKNTNNSLNNTGKTASGLRGKISTLGSGFRSLGSSIKSAASGFMSMYLGPMIIFAIIAAIISIISYTDSWGKITKLASDVMKTLAEALTPLITLLADVATNTWNALKTWEGWSQIELWISNAYQKLKDMYGWVQKNIQPTTNEQGETEPNAGQKNIPVIGPDLAAWSDFFTGSNIANFNDGFKAYVDLVIGLVNPLTTVVTLSTMMSYAINNFGLAIKQIKGESPTTFKDYAKAMLAFKATWEMLSQTVKGNWNDIKPAMDELMDAWNTLMETLFGKRKDTGGGGDPLTSGGKKISTFAQIVKIVIQLITLVIKGVSVVAPIITGIIKVIIMVIGGFSVIFSAIIYVVNAFIMVWRKFHSALLIVVNPILVVLYYMIQLWHWITGNSPGLIPAVQYLYNIIISFIPKAMSTFGIWLQYGIGRAIYFVNSVVAWFKSLPKKVYSAMASVKTYIIQQLKNAYIGAKSWVRKFYAIGVAIKNQVVAGIKSALGISSPSKVTYGLGENISQGLYNGMVEWVKNNSSIFTKVIAQDANAAAKILADLFSGFNWVFYYNSMQSVSTTLNTMTGNCYDAALAYQALAQKMGLVANLANTTVNGIAHTVISLPQIGMWVDPSGILGSGLQSGGIPTSGTPYILVNVNDATLKEDADVEAVVKKTVTKIYNGVKFGI